tara:strand:- start:32 stop:151 length:120 start_codon:yes stop_codon:yes gene_type:complete
LVILPSRLVTEMRFSNFRRKAVLILKRNSSQPLVYRFAG